MWNELGKAGKAADATEVKGTRWALPTRRAYGYHSPDALIAVAVLTRGGLCPPLPGRTT